MRIANLKSLILFVVWLANSSSLFAGGAEPKLVFHGIPHDMLYGLSFEGEHGLSVGDSGLVVETADGGQTWTRQPKVPTDLGLFSVVRKQGKCIAGGQGGLILHSADCKQWSAASSSSKARILSVHVNDSGLAYAVGGFGTVLKSSDWGKTWEPVMLDWSSLTTDGAEPHLYGVHVANDGEVTLAGEFELILRTRDNGNKWITLHKGKRSLFGLKLLENGEIYAVGQEGLILKSHDRGVNWSELKTGTHSILTGIWAEPNGQVVATGIYTVLYSSDAGKTWQLDKSKAALMGSHQAVASMEKDKARSIFLVGSAGSILSVIR